MCGELLVNQSTRLRGIRRQRYIVRKSGVPDGNPIGVVRQPTQSIHQLTSSLGFPGRFVHPIVPRPTSPLWQRHPVVDIAYSPAFERGQVRIRAGQRCNGSGLHILACRSEPLAGHQHAHGCSPPRMFAASRVSSRRALALHQNHRSSSACRHCLRARSPGQERGSRAASAAADRQSLGWDLHRVLRLRRVVRSSVAA